MNLYLVYFFVKTYFLVSMVLEEEVEDILINEEKDQSHTDSGQI